MNHYLPCRSVPLVVLWLAAGVLAGCASTATTRPANPADPWEKTNRAVDRFNDKLDRYALKPASDFYVKITTPKLRQSVHNAFTNLGEIDTIVNDLLEPKARQAGSDSLRLVVNSTLGIGGLFDMATPMGLKHHDEDFGLTLGHWGAGQGRYVVLPFFGPSTVRDAPGIAVGILDDPLTWIDAPWIIYPIDAWQMIDFRTSADNIFLFRNAAALDPYVFTRQAYLAHRQFLLEGHAAQTQPAEQIDYFEDEPATQPATQPAPPTQPGTGPAASQP